MTVSSDTGVHVPYVSYTGDGGTVAFSVPFTFYSNTELEVIERVTATGVETVKTLTTDYSVSGGSGTVGTVTMGTAPASTVQLHIRRATKREQQTDYNTADAFPAAQHELDLDEIVRMIQDLRRDIDRALLLPKTEDGLSGVLAAKPSRLGMLLGFNATTGLPEMAAGGAATYSEGTWTPVFTFATPGDLAITYSTQSAYYVKIGKLVLLNFSIVTSAFTHSTASGSARVTGSPFTAASTPVTPAIGVLTWGGITKANFTDYALQLNNGSSNILLTASGSAQARTNPVAADFPSGGTVELRGSIVFFSA